MKKKVYVPRSCYYGITCLDSDTGNIIKEYSSDLEHGYFLTPSVYEDKLIVAHYNTYSEGKSHLLCYNEDTTDILWQIDINSNIRHPPIVYEGKIYLSTDTAFSFNSGNCILYCIDVMNGKEIWKYTSLRYERPKITIPTIHNNKLYIGIGNRITPQNGTVICFNPNDGAEIWSYQLTQHVRSTCINNDKLYVHTYHYLICLDANNGDEIWNITHYGSISKQLSIGYDMIYFNDYKNSSFLTCYDSVTGLELWRNEAEENYIFYGGPAIADGKIYIGSQNSQLDYVYTNFYCFDAYNGQKIWEYTTIGKGETILDLPVIADSNVYFFDGSTLTLYCFGTSNYMPPEIPSINGPSSGKIETYYDFIFSTTDPNNYDVYYVIEWGDYGDYELNGPHQSGDEVTISNRWLREGDYQVKAKAKNIYGAESEWSDPIIFHVSKIKAINTQLFLQRFFQRFPFFEKILNQII